MDRKAANSLLALILAIGTLGIAAQAQAATITVDTGADTTPSGTECQFVLGDCSLRRALDKAVSGVDNIVIPATVPTITLVAGNGPLPVTKNLTISGQGPGANTITGQDNIGLFAITGQRTVTISGVTLTHGKAQSGAAVDTDGGHLTLNDVAVTNSTAGGANTSGFGVINVGGASPATLTITGSSFSSNHVGGGGTSGGGFGVVFASPSAAVDVAITNTDFTGNTIGGGGADAFGVLNVTPTGGVPTVDLESVVFRGNTVGSGGIGFGTVDLGGTGANQSFTVRNSIFDSNTLGGGATGVSNTGVGNGGGLFVSPNGTATLNVENTTFTNNKVGAAGGGGVGSGAGFGGGIYASFSSVATVSVSDSTFSGNTLGGAGGSGNSSGTGLGGGMFVSLAGTDGTLSVTGSEFSHNTLGGTGGDGTSSGDGFGGGIYASYPSTATLTIDRNSFSDGRIGGDGGSGNNGGSGLGGGLYLTGSAKTAVVSIANNTVTRNTVGGAGGPGTAAGAGFGGGLNLTGGTFNLLNNTIDANTSTAFGGGILGANGGSTEITLKNTIVSGNVALGSPNNCVDPLTSGGHNIEDTAPSQCGLSAPGDRVGVNPLLGPLGDNGGLTLTQALLAGSPAINAGDNSGCPATDQRGAVRPQEGVCDIGAYELVPPAPITGAGPPSTPITPKLTKLSLRPSKILPNKGRGPSISARKRGATVSYTNNTAATSTFTVQSPRRGYRSGKRCVAKKPKRGKARRCTFYKKVGSFTHGDKAGKNSFHFTGRVKRKPLKKGRYRFEVVSRQNGLKSGKVHKSFRIIRA